MTDLRSAPVPPLGPEDHVRGEAGAPLIVFYGDFTCPRCALAHARLSGANVRVAFRHFTLRARHPRALAAAHAAEAAHLQGAFWAMHDSLLADQGRLEDPHLWSRARQLGLDVDRLQEDRRCNAVAERVAADVRGALRAGVTVTPTLFVKGAMHPGPPDLEWIARLTPIH
jgi:protein-disulfide isomerase